MVTTSSMATRSSLELMLDKLQQLEEQPKGNPPALPVRPVSRARPRLPRPRQLDLENGGSSFSFSFCFERKRRKDEAIDGILRKIQESGISKETAEKGICKIQNLYRGHQVRRWCKELRRGVTALQSFIRGENARTSTRLIRAIITIQKHTRKYLKHQAAVEGEDEPRVRVPYAFLVDLQKRVVRAEAKLRGKEEENMALKRKLLEMEHRWQQYEERMKSMEKEWQDQLTYIQECLAARNKKNPVKQMIRLSNNGYQNPDHAIIDGCEEGEDGEEQVCLKLRPKPNEELRKLKLRFKAWKQDYKNKMRDAQSTFKKIGIYIENSKSNNKNWWGRLSH